MNLPKVPQIAQGIYWVGGSAEGEGLNCNPYLIVDGDEAVLIDPGSGLDFEEVYQNVTSLVPLEQIKYVILHHQDPDFCASVPLFEAKGAQFKIVTHWRTQSLVKYYGVKSEYYLVDDHDYKLTLSSGRVLTFPPTPYLHFSGAITTYDQVTKTLFSSDLFGAFSHEWSLYAGEDYIEKMKTFHEHYMPSNDILKPVMEVFLQMDISMIAPQHGSIIKNNIPTYIKTLRDLECGTFLSPIKKSLEESNGYLSICSTIAKRYTAIFSKQEVKDALSNLEITWDEEMNIIDYNYLGEDLWNLLFEKVYAAKGLQWLIVIEPLMQTIVQAYDIAPPKIFQAKLKRAEVEVVGLTEENLLLKKNNQRLQAKLKESEERLTRDPITGLYNQDFLEVFLSDEIHNIVTENTKQNPALIVLKLDEMGKIDKLFGREEVEAVFKEVVTLLESLKQNNSIVFRLEGPAFACYLQNSTHASALSFATTIRKEIAASEKFLEKITVSIGLVCLEEIKEQDRYHEGAASIFLETAIARTKKANIMGGNTVFSSSSSEDRFESSGDILLIDSDETNIDILKAALENIGFSVLVAKDGMTGVKLAEEKLPHLIISDIIVPQMDGFLIREQLLSLSATKKIPFFFMSYLKTEDTVKRSLNLGVEHYFKKPYMLSEILGLVRNKTQGE